MGANQKQGILINTRRLHLDCALTRRHGGNTTKTPNVQRHTLAQSFDGAGMRSVWFNLPP